MPNIILKNREGESIVYSDILTVTFDTDDGEQAVFAYVPPIKNTTAKIVDGILILNNAAVSEDNTLNLTGSIIDDTGALVIDKE